MTVSGCVCTTGPGGGGGLNNTFISWTLPANGASAGLPATCAQAGVTTMYVAIDNQPLSQAVQCTDGTNGAGLALNLSPGTRSIDIAGGLATGLNNAQGQPNVFYLYRKLSTLQVTAQGGSNTYSLDWNAGTLLVDWSFSNGLSCAQNNVSEVQLFIYDANNNLVDLPPDATMYRKDFASDRTSIVYRYDCNFNRGTFNYVNGGPVRVVANAVNGQGQLIASSTAQGVSATVTNGQFAPTPVRLVLGR
jgi:hypothetical protein